MCLCFVGQNGRFSSVFYGLSSVFWYSIFLGFSSVWVVGTPPYCSFLSNAYRWEPVGDMTQVAIRLETFCQVADLMDSYREVF